MHKEDFISPSPTVKLKGVHEDDCLSPLHTVKLNEVQEEDYFPPPLATEFNGAGMANYPRVQQKKLMMTNCP